MHWFQKHLNEEAQWSLIEKLDQVDQEFEEFGQDHIVVCVSDSEDKDFQPPSDDETGQHSQSSSDESESDMDNETETGRGRNQSDLIECASLADTESAADTVHNDSGGYFEPR